VQAIKEPPKVKKLIPSGNITRLLRSKRYCCSFMPDYSGISARRMVVNLSLSHNKLNKFARCGRRMSLHDAAVEEC